MPRHLRVVVALAGLLLAGTQTVSAHRDDFINETLVYLTLSQGELEAEYWFDDGSSSEPQGDFVRHNVAVERGVTGHWMVDGRVTAIERGTMAFDSARLESRYRFADEGTFPVDLAVSFEVNTEREPDGSRGVGVEPRLILSRDFGETLNLTGNLAEEVPVDGGPSAFLVAFGSRFNWTRLVRVGSEVQYNVDERSGAVIPQVWLAFPHEITLKAGYSIGLDRAPDDFARIALEVEF